VCILDRAISSTVYNVSAGVTRILDVRPTRVWAIIQNLDDAGSSEAHIYFGGEAAGAGVAYVLKLNEAVDQSGLLYIDSLHPWDGEVYADSCTALLVIECWI